MEGPPDDAVTLEIQGFPLQCRRSTLIQNSDYFRAMFDGNYVESHKSVITLKDVDLEAVKLILKVLWDHEYIVPETSIISVLQASTMLQFLAVKELCLERIEGILSPKNCLRFWVHTETLGLKNIYCKAKLMALMEFREVKNTPYFFELSLDEVINYLGDVNLQCPHEFTVFEALIQWYSKSEEKNQDTLVRLLKCVNFTALSADNIKQIEESEVGSDITDILKCIKTIQKNEKITGLNGKSADLAKQLLSSKERNFNGFPCILVDNVDQTGVDSTVLYYDKFRRKRKYNVLDNTQSGSFLVVYVDVHTRSLKRLFDIETFKCELLTGFKVTGYKNFVYFYGGEYLLGKGNWNTNIHVYDVIKEDWKLLELKYSRRHFESCVCGKYLFIVGGTGSFRVIQENIFWYDLEKDEWSDEVKLPCSGRQIKCCRFQNQLFVLDVTNKCGYTFSPSDANNDGKWTRLAICDNGSLPVFSNNFQVFSYRNNLYIKINKLYQLKLEGSSLVMVSEINLPDHFDETNSCMESVLSNGVLYSLLRQSNDDNNKKINTTTVELFNVDTCENTEIYRTENDIISINNENFKFKSTLIMFNVFHPNLVDRNDLI